MSNVFMGWESYFLIYCFQLVFYWYLCKQTYKKHNSNLIHSLSNSLKTIRKASASFGYIFDYHPDVFFVFKSSITSDLFLMFIDTHNSFVITGFISVPCTVKDKTLIAHFLGVILHYMYFIWTYLCRYTLVCKAILLLNKWYIDK